MDQNITTFIRIKPTKSDSGYFSVDEIDRGALVATLPESFKSEYIDNSKLKHTFSLNGIMDRNCTQEDIFKSIGVPAVQNAFEGFNSTIFVYGQTGSGKTFTLTGGSDRYSDRGIIPRAISMIFSEVRNRKGREIKVTVSYFEIYNEQGYDLLALDDGKSLEDLPRIKILEDDNGGFHLKNLTVHTADSEEAALNLLFLGDTNRAVAETPMNLASSRSHCIFLVNLESREHGSDKVRKSKLNLIDLAGSERIGKTNANGAILKEAKYINSSLFYLEVVITALRERATIGRTHIPYRNSLMTSILKDSLGGNCKTIMIATISPEPAHTDESLSTCRFAQRVSQIKNHVTVNEELDPALLVRRLKSEILVLREEISFLKGDKGEEENDLTPLQYEELQSKCREYCKNRDISHHLNIGKLSLTKLKQSFTIFRSLVWEAEDNPLNQLRSTDSSNGNKPMNTISPENKLEDNNITLIQDLKSSLLQRQEEIEILVNMIKQGKTVQDISKVASNGNQVSRSTTNQTRLESKDSSINSTTSQSSINSTSQVKEMRQDVQNRVQRQRLREQQILKTRLFGVYPPNQKILENPAASFDWFQTRCSLKGPIEENMILLQDVVKDAKIAGEHANHSRSKINYLKSSIEAIRRERALEKVSYSSSLRDEEKCEEESEEERLKRGEIEKEKAIYKESFEQLRILKPRIEHIRKVIEKCRNNMMNQYDQWFSYLSLHIDDLSLEGLAINTEGEVNESVISDEGESTLQLSQTRIDSDAQPRYSSLGSNTDYKVTEDRSKAIDVDDDIAEFYCMKEEMIQRQKKNESKN